MTVVRTITKNVISRAWNDLEPKLVAFLATGLSASVVIEAANYLGWDINPGLAAVIATVVATVFGYLKSSTSKVLADPAPIVAAPPAYVAPQPTVTPDPIPVTPADPNQPAAGTEPPAVGV